MERPDPNPMPEFKLGFGKLVHLIVDQFRYAPMHNSTHYRGAEAFIDEIEAPEEVSEPWGTIPSVDGRDL